MSKIIKKSIQFSLLSLFVIAGFLGAAYGLESETFSAKKSVEIKKIETKTPSVFPSVKSITPSDLAMDVILDIEDPITIDFNGSTRDFFIKFVIDPYGEVVYENNPEKTQFRLLPKDAIVDNQEYKIDVFAKYKNAGDNTYKKIFSSSFTTLPPIPTNWEKDLTLRIEQAQRYTRPKIREGKYIDINLASQIMTVFEQGKAVESFVVSSGKRGMDTPKGSFEIFNKAKRPFSREYGLYMPNWMALVPSGKIGIHELPEWPGGYKEGANHLGTPVSHGCVRLGVGSSKKVYEWAEIGTPVVIY